MNQVKGLLLLGIFIEIFGCAKGQKVASPPPEVNPQTDPDNCGHKGNACISRGAGACFEGYCRCNDDHNCHWPEVCRDGICQPQDKNGYACWADNDCEINQYCIAGHCSPRVCLTEVCDGYDNNCDGQVDEPEKTDIVCYTGPPATLGVGACHAGVRSCFMGMYTWCLHEFTPHAEVGRFACDRQDSDCDGCIDGTGGGTIGCKVAPIPHVSFVFLLDTSGSMDGYLKAAKMFLAMFSKFRGDPRFDYCLMDVAAADPPYIKVIQSCVDFDAFLAALNSFKYGQNGDEPTYDAVYQVSTGYFDMELELKPDSMPVEIVIGDEPAQTLTMPVLNEFLVCDAVDSRSALLSVITRPERFVDWNECAADFTFPLSTDSTEMFKSLDGVFSLPCFEN